MPRYAKKREYEEDDSGEDERVKSAKKIKGPGAHSPTEGAKAKDAEGNPYWELSAKRRVTASKFNKKLFVNIREYYEADGELRPGKKGISLSIDQYKAFLKAIPGINGELRREGHELDDPVDDGAGEKLKSSEKPSKKANIEATSDEESD